MKDNESLRGSLERAMQAKASQLQAERLAREEEETNRARIARITKECERAEEIARKIVKPTSDITVLNPGDRLDYVSPWVTVETRADETMLQARLHKETGLVDLKSGSLLRYWGRYFNGRHARVWVDVRLANNVGGEVIGSEPEEGAFCFSDETGEITIPTDDGRVAIQPGTEDWQDMEQVLSALQ